jgi:putative transposase
MGWDISNSMSKQWCMNVLETAMAENGVSEIINSDQGSQYASPSWTNYLEGKGIEISMDGKLRATAQYLDRALLENHQVQSHLPQPLRYWS